MQNESSERMQSESGERTERALFGEETKKKSKKWGR